MEVLYVSLQPVKISLLQSRTVSPSPIMNTGLGYDTTVQSTVLLNTLMLLSAVAFSNSLSHFRQPPSHCSNGRLWTCQLGSDTSLIKAVSTFLSFPGAIYRVKWTFCSQFLDDPTATEGTDGDLLVTTAKLWQHLKRKGGTWPALGNTAVHKGHAKILTATSCQKAGKHICVKKEISESWGSHPTLAQCLMTIAFIKSQMNFTISQTWTLH